MIPAGRLFLAARLARRELRGGMRGFGVFLACLFLGVFSVSAVGSLASAARRGLAADARSLLGGDLQVSLVHRELPPATRAFLEERGEVSAVTRLRSMVRPAKGGRAELAEVKGVDDAYPLYGSVVLAPAKTLEAALAERGGRYGAAAEESLLKRLGLAVGGTLRLGEAEYEVRAVLLSEPDRAPGTLSIAPHLLVARESLPETGLLAPGSLLRHDYRLRLPEGTSEKAVMEELRGRFPGEGWRVDGYTEAAPRLRESLDRLDTSLTLVGLSALLIGGLGVAGGVRGYLGGKLRHLAAMKCLGAEVSLLFSAYLLQILLLGAAGAGAGLAAGAALPFLVAGVAGGLLPVPLAPRVEPAVLALAGAYGLLTALLFSLPALGGAGRVSPAVLFRGGGGEAPPAGRKVRIAAGGAALLLAALATATAGNPRLALGFAAGTGGCFLLFRLLAKGLPVLARRAPRGRRAAWHLALANLRRPGGPAGQAVFSLGLGLTALVAVVLVQANLAALVEEDLPRQAPAFFFFDIQPDQTARFDRLLAGAGGKGARIDRRPTLRGRITAIAGVPTEKAAVRPEAAWAVRGDRFLTYASLPPEGSRIVAGRWWPPGYAGEPLVSLTADLAEGFGVGVGDTLTVNVLGREVTARIAALREVDWTTLDLEFALIFSPGLLESAPHTWIAAVHLPREREEAAYDAVTGELANVSAVRVREVLANISRLFERLGIAFRLLAGIALLAGLLVLAGALAADQHRRLADAVVFKVCGARRREILAAYALEFLLVGGAAGLLAALAGTAAAWGVTEKVLEIGFTFRPAAVLLTVVLGLAAALLLGLAGTARVLARRPAPYLRNE